MSTETKEYKENTITVTDAPTGPWDSALDTLRELDPKCAKLCFKMSTNPWTHPVLPRKFIELVSVSLNAACTNLNAERNSTSHPGRARSGCDPRGDIIRPQVRIGLVDSLLQPGRSNCFRRSQSCQRPS